MKTNDIKAKIEALQNEAQAIEKLSADMPASIPEPAYLCWHHSSLCEFSYTYHVKDVSEVKALVMAWSPFILPLELYKGSFTGFRTPEHKEGRDTDKTEPVYPVTVKVGYFGLGFDFYALVNGHLLNVNVDFEHGLNWQKLAHVSYQAHANKYGDKWVDHVYLNTPGFNKDQYIKWAQGSREYPNDFTLYWRDGVINLFDDIFAEVK